MFNLLIVDDEEGIREVLTTLFRSKYQVYCASNAREAMEILKLRPINLAFFDIIMPEKNGIELIKEVRVLKPDLPVIMISVSDHKENIEAALKSGANDFVAKPFDYLQLKNLAARLMRESGMARNLEIIRREKDLHSISNHLLGESPAFRNMLDRAQKLAQGEFTLLITGARGSGKDSVAEFLHRGSPQNIGPFMSIQTSAFTATTLDEEIFGIASKSTQSDTSSLGRLDITENGTLLIKDIEHMPLSIQRKLRGVILDHRFRLVDGGENVPCFSRIYFSSTLDLETLKQNDIIDAALLESVGENIIEVPPLSERPEDIPLLAYHFLNRSRHEIGGSMKDINQSAMALLRQYRWPGNVRELKAIIERCMAIYGDKPVLQTDALPVEIRNRVYFTKTEDSEDEPRPKSLEGSVRALERELIIDALTRADGRISKAAEILHSSPRIVKYRIKSLGIKMNLIQ